MTLAYGGEHMRRPEAPSVPPAAPRQRTSGELDLRVHPPVVVPAERGPHEAVDVDAVVVVVHVVPGDQHGDVRGTADQDGRTTILVGSATHIAVLIAGNHVHHDYYGIYIDGFVRATFGGNHYRRVHTQVKFT